MEKIIIMRGREKREALLLERSPCPALGDRLKLNV